ncbi:MAG: hypothetical protein ACK52I_24910 [Pseudomonadota bacterium]
MLPAVDAALDVRRRVVEHPFDPAAKRARGAIRVSAIRCASSNVARAARAAPTPASRREHYELLLSPIAYVRALDPRAPLLCDSRASSIPFDADAGHAIRVRAARSLLLHTGHRS